MGERTIGTGTRLLVDLVIQTQDTQDLGSDVTKINTKFSITHAQTFHVGKDYISETIIMGGKCSI